MFFFFLAFTRRAYVNFECIHIRQTTSKRAYYTCFTYFITRIPSGPLSSPFRRRDEKRYKPGRNTGLVSDVLSKSFIYCFAKVPSIAGLTFLSSVTISSNFRKRIVHWPGLGITFVVVFHYSKPSLLTDRERLSCMHVLLLLVVTKNHSSPTDSREQNVRRHECLSKTAQISFFIFHVFGRPFIVIENFSI